MNQLINADNSELAIMVITTGKAGNARDLTRFARIPTRSIIYVYVNDQGGLLRRLLP
jgi:hypothetical protein